MQEMNQKAGIDGKEVGGKEADEKRDAAASLLKS